MTSLGRYRSERVELARLPSGTAIETTVHFYGPDSGPKLYVQAAQHGREVNGTEVCRRLHDRLQGAALRGRVVVVPVVDPLTFDRVSYTTPEPIDSINSNMNRVWPGDVEGTLHQRMAATLWEYATETDAVIDLHTGSPSMLSHVIFKADHDQSRRLAMAFGTDLLLSEPAGENAPAEWSRRRFGGKFRVAAAREGLPAITPELSYNRQIVESAVETGVAGVLDVCRSMGILDGSPADHDPTIARNHLGTVDAGESGLFRPATDLSLGERVASGREIGRVYDPTTYDELERAESNRDGLLYSLTREATVTAGDRLAALAIPEE